MPGSLGEGIAGPASQFPGWSLAALIFALSAQFLLEPPEPHPFPGTALYGIAVIFLAQALRTGEWKPGQPRCGASPGDSDPIRRLSLLAALGCGLGAFLLMGANRFTPLNVGLWLLATFLLLNAFRFHMFELPITKRALNIMRSRGFRVTVTWWTVLTLVVLGFILFYRFHDLRGVPGEPFSDHAEKLLDVYDITQGETRVFFPRNTGREAFQFYWTLLVATLLGTGLTFLSLKIGTALLGLFSVFFTYLLGRELGGRRVGLLAAFLYGIAYWPNVISRIGLRFPLYPLFVAPTLYYLIRGLRRQNRSDFVMSGLFLGLGLHGYTPFRIVPIMVCLTVGIYLLHKTARGQYLQTIRLLGVLALTGVMVALPLLAFAAHNPDLFAYRALTRLYELERPLPASWYSIFASNLWTGLKMFNWDNGEIWIQSIPHRPALDVVSAALFLLGVALLLMRYSKRRDWRDLFLLVSIPLLMMPSILSLAYPSENPAPSRAGGAAVPVFIVAALALDGFRTGIRGPGTSRIRRVSATGLLVGLLTCSAVQNYDLVFHQFNDQFRRSSWNTSEIGAVIRSFVEAGNRQQNSWVVPFPHWVDTRLVGVWAGYPNRDFALWPDDFERTAGFSGHKLFILKEEDQQSVEGLQELYPQAQVSLRESKVPGKNFWVAFVP